MSILRTNLFMLRNCTVDFSYSNCKWIIFVWKKKKSKATDFESFNTIALAVVKKWKTNCMLTLSIAEKPHYAYVLWIFRIICTRGKLMPSQRSKKQMNKILNFCFAFKIICFSNVQYDLWLGYTLLSNLLVVCRRVYTFTCATLSAFLTVFWLYLEGF